MQTTRIKRSEVAALLAAHKSLNGDLESKTRYAVARNIVHLIRTHRDTERFRVALLKEIEPETHEIKPDSPKFDEFRDRFYDFLETDVEISLFELKFDGLNIEKNAISPGAIAALESILVLDNPAHNVTG